MIFLQLLQYEMERTFRNRKILLLFLLTAICNLAVVFLYFRADDISYSEYKQIREVCKRDPESIPDMYMEHMDSPEWEQLYQEYQVANGYTSYLQQVQDDAEKESSVSIFQSAFSSRNIRKTAADYRMLEGVTFAPAGSYGLARAISFPGSKILIVAAIYILVAEVVTGDKRSEILSLLRATQQGKYRMAWAKLLAVLTGTIVIHLLVRIGCVGMSFCCYGTVSLDVPVQALWGYSASGMQTDIGGYLIRMVLLYSLIFCCIAFFFFLVASGTDNMVSDGCITAVCFLLLWLIYRFGQEKMYIWPEKISLYNLLNEEHVFCYYNMNVAEFPVDILCVTVVLGGLLLILLALAGVYMSGNVSSDYRRIHLRCKQTMRSHVSGLTWMEGYRFFIGSRAWLILLILLCWQMIYYLEKNPGWYQDEVYYRYYIKQVEGDYSLAKTEYLNEEKERLTDIQKEEDRYLEAYNNGEISEKIVQQKTATLETELAKWNGLDMACAYVSYVEDLTLDDKGIVYDRGWNFLSGGSRYRNDLANAAIVMTAVMIGLSGIFTEDYRYGIAPLLKLTYQYGKAEKRRGVIAFLYISICYASVYLPELIWTVSQYGLPGGDYAVQSVSRFAGVNISVTLSQYLILVYCIRFVTVMLLGFAIAYMGKAMKKASRLLVVSFVVVMLPLLFSLCGIDEINTCSFNALLSGNILLR